MELSELNETWQRLEEALERANRFSEETLRRQKLDATQKSLRPLKLNQIFQILFGGIALDDQADGILGHLERSDCAGLRNRLHPHGGVGVLFSESH